MNKSTKKIIAREFLYVLFNSILFGIAYFEDAVFDFKIPYFAYIWVVSMSFCFVIRYLYYATKWSLKQLREE